MNKKGNKTMKPKCLIFSTGRQGKKTKRIVKDWKVVVGRTYISGTRQGYANKADLIQSMHRTIEALKTWLAIEAEAFPENEDQPKQ
jgi:hypothetical protein